MTFDEFISALGEVAEKEDWEWRIDSWGRLRARKGLMKACPITAVSYAKCGELRSPRDAMVEARGVLGMDRSVASSVIHSADGHDKGHAWNHKGHFDKDIRESLLRATGTGGVKC